MTADSAGGTATRDAPDAPPASTAPARASRDTPSSGRRGGSSLDPTARRLWTRGRGLLLAAVVLLVAAVALAAVRSGDRHGRLDPRSADPLGSRAVAALLADRGVSTRVVTSTAAARAAAGPGTTLLVADPDLLTAGQQAQLRSATAHSGGRTVLVAPSVALRGLVPGVSAEPSPSLRTTLGPGCALPAARRAGPADTGGIRYATSVAGADSCYPSDGRPTLVRLPTAGRAGDTVVLGAPDILFNNRLDQQGNASLALQLLGSRPHLVWYLPSLADHAATGAAHRSFYDLIPSGWHWGLAELAVAALLAAAWRARRLGPLVPERLPVVVRASETTEGRAGLYRRADARDRAADALRAAARTRLAPLTGIPAAQAHSPEALVPALAARLRPDAPVHRWSPAHPTSPVHSGSPMSPGAAAGPGDRHTQLHALLFGPPPSDDAALVALADHLDALEGEVRRS
jgi:hypothetical protein